MSRYADCSSTRQRRRGFSLVEMVLVVTILGVLASIAIPRMTTASSSAQQNALQATLANVRKAIDIYYAEHDRYPGYDHVTGLPDGTAFLDQLLKYSDFRGETNSTPNNTYKYGPYLRSPFPVNPFNGLDTVQVKAAPADADPAEGSVGWVAVLSHGYFGISATDSELDTIDTGSGDLKDIVRGAGTSAPP